MKKHNEWIIFKREEWQDAAKDFDFDKLLSVRINNDFFECLYTGEGKFHSVKILRHVLVPYVVDGKPRGWFKGKNDEPLRWTGIGNILYMSGENAEEAFYALLDALAGGKIDSRFMKQIDSFIGFAPTKLSLV